MTLFDFDTQVDIYNWRIVDDVVMGGRSNGRFELNEYGQGRYYGKVSLENNGGFSSLRYRFRTQDVSQFSKFKIRLKGDGKKYQFRSKSDSYDRHSYIYSFETTGEWETIEVPFTEMEPGFRGMRLRMANYPGERLEEIAILIGNKKPESFELLIDKIEIAE